jgi:hypothetical protein
MELYVNSIGILGTPIMEYWATTVSITVQTAATYTVTTTNASGCTSLQGSGVTL